jgi:hypothetical protein
VLFGSGFALPVIPWPGDVASRRGPLAPTVSERTVCVARPEERPDLFDVAQRFNGAFFIDATRRFAPVAVQNQLFAWFSSASLDDFAAADRSTLYSIAAAIGVFRVDVDFDFFEDEDAFSEPTARLRRRIDKELKNTRAFYLQHATTTALAFSVWKSLGANGVPRNSPPNIDPQRTVARFDSGTMQADNVLTVTTGKYFELRLFHFDRHGKFLPVPDSSMTHVQLDLPDGSVIDSRQDWITNGDDDEEDEAELSQSSENGASVDLSGSGSFNPIDNDEEDEIDDNAAQDIDIPRASPLPLASSILQFTPAQFVHFSMVSIRFNIVGAYKLRYFVEDELSFEQQIAVGSAVQSEE